MLQKKELQHKLCMSQRLISFNVLDKTNMHKIKMGSVPFWLIWDLFAIIYESCMCTTYSITEENDEETWGMRHKLPVGIKVVHFHVSHCKTFYHDLNLVIAQMKHQLSDIYVKIRESIQLDSGCIKTHLQRELSVTLPIWKSYSLVRIRITCKEKNQALHSWQICVTYYWVVLWATNR